MTSSPWIRRAAVLACCVLAACSTTKHTATDPLPSTSHGVASTAPAGAPAPSASKTAVTALGSAVASARAANTAPPPPKAAPDIPPAAGTYTYTQTGGAKAGSFALKSDPSGTLFVAQPQTTPDGRKQKQTRDYSSTQNRTQTLIFTSRAVLLEQTSTSYGGQTTNCKTTKPLELIRLPLVVGARWSGSGTCEAGSVSFNAKVLRAEPRTVGGIRVNTFVVHHEFHITGSGATQDIKLDSWLSPDYRLSVYSTEHGTGTFQATSFTTDTTETLDSLTPAS